MSFVDLKLNEEISGAQGYLAIFSVYYEFSPCCSKCRIAVLFKSNNKEVLKFMISVL
jgi:hypothetical protein